MLSKDCRVLLLFIAVFAVRLLCCSFVVERTVCNKRSDMPVAFSLEQNKKNPQLSFVVVAAALVVLVVGFCCCSCCSCCWLLLLFDVVVVVVVVVVAF